MTEELEIQNLPRFCNEAMILSVLESGERHGYQLAMTIEEESRGYFSLQHGTLYPILHRLEKEGKIKGRWKKKGSGRRRKVYSLTGRGKRYLREGRKQWKIFCNNMNAVLGDK